jgi:hypothetical protein
VESDAASHCRHADTVAVVADSFDNPLKEVLRVFAVEITEIQRVSECDWVGTHRECIPNDTADAGRRPVERVDVRRVIVALDTHRDVGLRTVFAHGE